VAKTPPRKKEKKYELIVSVPTVVCLRWCNSLFRWVNPFRVT